MRFLRYRVIGTARPLPPCLVAWVKKGTPPDSIFASVSSANVDKPAAWSGSRSRPQCAYPKKAVLKGGATDLERASSFICQ